jgi:ATP-dependent DNA helicase RecG
MSRVIFVSSVQSEFAKERAAIRDFVRGDALLGKHFDVFLFEDQPAQSRGPVQLYTEEVERCDVYLVVIGRRYGFEDKEGVSATEREFDRAVARRKHRIAFVKADTDKDREPKEASFLKKLEDQIKRSKFAAVGDLTGQVYASLIYILEQERAVTTLPFDARASSVKLTDLNAAKVRAFQDRAAEVRHSVLKRVSGMKNVLSHLNLMDGPHPNNAAVLLFGEPKRTATSAETKCLHYGGTVPARPALSYQTFVTTLPEQIDAAVEFVMSRLARSVGERDEAAQVPVQYEIPQAAVSEAIINAIAHRDYTAGSAVQVSLFSDRVEVSNPGELPRGLTPEQLRHVHPSIPRNPLISEVLFLSGYIEKAGTGTTEMIRRCRKAGLPEPDFRQLGDQWVVTLWRDWLTPGFIAEHGLNDRQAKGLELLRQARSITNSQYRKATGAIAKTAARDLEELVEKGVLRREGAGRGVRYTHSGQ